MKNYFSQLFIVYGINDITQTEMHTAESSVPQPSSFGVEITI